MYAQEYKSVTSTPVHISPLDMGPKYADKVSGLQEYCKTYGENYCLGQLIFWHNQTSVEPDCSLVRASRGCLSLPDIGCFYAKVQKPSRHRVYGPKTLKFMLSWMVSFFYPFWNDANAVLSSLNFKYRDTWHVISLLRTPGIRFGCLSINNLIA